IFLSMGLIGVLFYASQVSASAPVRYKIDRIIDKSAHADCGIDTMKSAFIKGPGVINDPGNNPKARLSPAIVIESSDCFSSTGTCVSTCAVNCSSMTIYVNEECLDVAGSTTCKSYHKVPISITVTQRIYCDGKLTPTCTRTITVKGGFSYDACTNR